MNVLNLRLKKRWFDMIASGEKKEEYREIKPYWFRRLVFQHDKVFKFNTGYDFSEGLYLQEGVEHSIDKNNFGFKPFDVVRFTHGYSRNAPTIEVKCDGIQVDYGMMIWGAEKDVKYFVIQLGDKIA